MKTEKAYRFFASLRMTVGTSLRMTVGTSLRMTVLAVLALAALSLGSCVEIQGPEEAGWSELEGDVPVQFSTTVDTPATKATSPLPNNTKFGVFAYYTGNSNWSGSATPNFMYNQQVQYKSSKYTYSPIKYWPNNTGDKITFWAYYPYSSNTNSPTFKLYKNDHKATTTYNKTTNDFPDVGFTVSTGKVDFMTTNSNSYKSLTKPAVGATVSLTFYHRLAKINVKVKKQDPTSRYTVMLKSVRLDGIYMTGLFYSQNWYKLSNQQNFTVFADDPDVNTDDIELSASATNDFDVMLLPQTFVADGAKLHIEYSLNYTGLSHERTNAAEVDLSSVFSSVASKWEKNKQYNLEITIIPDDPIEFTVSWSDWGDVYNYHITS